MNFYQDKFTQVKFNKYKCLSNQISRSEPMNNLEMEEKGNLKSIIL